MNEIELLKIICYKTGKSHTAVARLIGYSGNNVHVSISNVINGKRKMSGPAIRALNYLARDLGLSHDIPSND